MMRHMSALISKVIFVAVAILQSVIADAVVARESLTCEEECNVVSLLQTGLKLREEHVETQAESWVSLTGLDQNHDRSREQRLQKKSHAEPEVIVQCFDPICGNHTKTGYVLIPPADLPEESSWLSTKYQLYGLNRNTSAKREDGMFQLVTHDGKCSLTVPFHVDQFPRHVANVDVTKTVKFANAKEPQHSGFTHGECPRVLPVAFKKTLNLGFNPGMTRMPAKLKTVFPTGKWLALSRNNLQVLDRHFDAIVSAKVELRGVPHMKYISKMLNDTAFLDEELLRDARIYLMNDHTVALSFTPYDLQDTSFKLDATPGASWWFHQVFGKLQVDTVQESTGVRLAAWVDRKDLRNLEKCKGSTAKNFWPDNAVVKNTNFMQGPTGDDIYLVDWIHPTGIGKLDLTSSPKPSAKLPFFGVSCFGYDEPSKLQDSSVLGVKPPESVVDVKMRLLKGVHIKQHQPSGSSGLIWIDEIQQFLGVGHFYRGFADSVEVPGRGAGSFGHHYTHVFYTISKEPPFRLTGLSTEFCFPSDIDAQDCEVIQFVTSLERDGDKLAMAYGVMDLYASVATVDLGFVLKSLRPVA